MIQDFENPEAPPHEGELTRSDLELVLYELLLADLDQVERRIERIKSGKPSKINQEELALLQKLKSALEAEIRFLPWNCRQRKSLWSGTTAS